jgi:flagellar assembly protein FliH
MSKGSFAPAGKFRPWHPGNFDGPAQPMVPTGPTEEVVLPTAAELEAMQEQARQEGYDSGYREGLAQGQAETQTLLAFSDTFHREIHRLDEAVAAEVATLALAIAQRVIGAAYTSDPELVTRMVEVGLQHLPANLDAARVLLHPDDLATVTQHVGAGFAGRNITLVADRTISRGGCRVLSATTDIDGTLESRWARVTEVLGSQPWVPLPTRPDDGADCAEVPA